MPVQFVIVQKQYEYISLFPYGFNEAMMDWQSHAERLGLSPDEHVRGTSVKTKLYSDNDIDFDARLQCDIMEWTIEISETMKSKL